MGKDSRKRKDPEELGDAPPPKNHAEDDDDESDEDIDMLNVDFEWFDPSPDVDFHGLKTLLRQLFDVDNQLFNLSELADMILAQPLLGSTVKVDGLESDPYAFLTVLNMHEHKDKQVIKDLAKYFAQKASSSPSLAELPALLDPSSPAQVGLILTERFINMPSEIVPPMYTMLQEEIQWALDEKEPYQFSHYLIVSKTYLEVESKLDMEENRPNKKKRKDGSAGAEVFYFHPEDEVLHKHALAHSTYEYTKQGDEGASDAKRAFQDAGIKPMGHLMLIEASKFAGAVKAVTEYIGGPAAQA
ncbi:Protein bcp1 [Lasiodiplodia hormozganensis]|uniref:Protein BCP1 n=1 Tax=Lasiodiplodia hormozganensis TaxID=869390 RepID=A0AA39Z5U5_9PEZI|nr:Protein bcp1 [Lasiodiplodia hormozganensis]